MLFYYLQSLTIRFAQRLVSTLTAIAIVSVVIFLLGALF